MKIERKRAGRTSPQKIAEGPCCARSFDGYNLTLHFFDSDGRQVRVILERHEAQHAAQFLLEELETQRRKVAELRQVADRVLA